MVQSALTCVSGVDALAVLVVRHGECHAGAVDEEEQYGCCVQLQEDAAARHLHLIRPRQPVHLSRQPQRARRHSPRSGQRRVRHSQRRQSEVPQKVLRRHHLVEAHKGGRLQGEAEGEGAAGVEEADGEEEQDLGEEGGDGGEEGREEGRGAADACR